jgi:magnesium chelatase subunit I
MISGYTDATVLAREEIQAARDILPQVQLPDEVARRGLALIAHLQIDSLRAEITLFEAARAHSAIDARLEVIPEDLREVAPMALRLRRSPFMAEYFTQQKDEEDLLTDIIDKTL